MSVARASNWHKPGGAACRGKRRQAWTGERAAGRLTRRERSRWRGGRRGEQRGPRRTSEGPILDCACASDTLCSDRARIRGVGGIPRNSHPQLRTQVRPLPPPAWRKRGTTPLISLQPRRAAGESSRRAKEDCSEGQGGTAQHNMLRHSTTCCNMPRHVATQCSKSSRRANDARAGGRPATAQERRTSCMHASCRAAASRNAPVPIVCAS